MPEIREILKRIVREFSPQSDAIFCTVKSRDDSNLICVCTPINGIDSDIPDVRLVAGAGNGIIFFPRVGSIVLVQPFAKDQTAYLAMVSQLDKIQMLDGSFGGLVEVANLTTKLNNLENKVNSIISTFNTHVHSGVQTGAGSSAVSPTQVSGTLTPTNRGDIENTYITHGNV